MRRLATIFLLCTGIVINASAQTFTQRIQQHSNGQGTVIIHQDDDINKLVNSEVLNDKQPAKSTTPTVPSSSTTGKNNPTTKPTTPTTKPTTKPTTANTEGDSETDEPAPDLSKKVMRNAVKVNGYRVQAFAGGNSRKDRIQAEQVGNTIKSHFANVPVYVHFYSPRWICRVGNYRTYEEAHQMLVQLRNLGYNQASIVKGKITVQY
jgi:hypothetical protein